MRTILVLLFVVAIVTPATAQVLPAEEGAWTLLVETSGGIAGQGAGRFLVNSLGRLGCPAAAACANALAPDRLRELTTLVASAAPQKWEVSPPLCSDCFRVRLLLTRREQGVVREYRAEWDEPLATSLDARALYQTVVKQLRPTVSPALQVF